MEISKLLRYLKFDIYFIRWSLKTRRSVLKAKTKIFLFLISSAWWPINFLFEFLPRLSSDKMYLFFLYFSFKIQTIKLISLQYPSKSLHMFHNFSEDLVWKFEIKLIIRTSTNFSANRVQSTFYPRHHQRIKLQLWMGIWIIEAYLVK